MSALNSKTEPLPAPVPVPVHTRADAVEDRRRRLAPYHRASQRELVRMALMNEGRFDDFHGDRKAA